MRLLFYSILETLRLYRMDNGLEPTVGMKKEGRLILAGFVVPSFHTKMEYTNNFPHISYWSPPDPTYLIMPDPGENTRISRNGWYFQKRQGETNPFEYLELYRVRNFCRNLIDFLNKEYPIYYKGSKMRWNLGSLNQFMLQMSGDVSIEIEEAARYYSQFQQGLSAFVGESVYPMTQNERIRPRERQMERARLLKGNLEAIQKETWKYHPNRVTKGTRKLMAEEGLNSYNAFKKVIEGNNLYNVNVTAEGVGEAYGPWENGRVWNNEEEVPNENNNFVEGGKRRYRRRRTRRSKRFV